MKLLKIIFLFFTCINSHSCSDNFSNGNNQESIITVDNINLDDLNNTDYNILFVGNSLTYTNNLPELVKQKASEKGINLGIKRIVKPNYAIVDHWAEGDVQELIKSKKFDYVVIQQGPSSQQEGRDMLIEGGKKYAELCADNNAKLCYFMVWPSLTYYHTFDGVIKNHEDAATINNAILCPVGIVWKDHFDVTNEFDYYSSDGFHPSLLGSQTAANVIVDTLF
jgi:hypothetical protein